MTNDRHPPDRLRCDQCQRYCRPYRILHPPFGVIVLCQRCAQRQGYDEPNAPDPKEHPHA